MRQRQRQRRLFSQFLGPVWLILVLFGSIGNTLGAVPKAAAPPEDKPADVNQEEGIKWGGNFILDQRAWLQKANQFSFKEYRLEFQAEARTEKTKFSCTCWVRSLGFPSVGSSYDLFVREKIAPVDGQIREAYVDLYGFLFPWLDLRIGRQRIAWGTGDRVNPTDNLNPDDLEDIWDFGRHLGSEAIKVNCYFKPFTLTGVLIPNFTPAVLPLADWAEAFFPSFQMPGLTISNLRDEVILPANNFKDSATAGLKISTNFRGYDFSLSYVRGRDDLPLLRDIIVENITEQNVDALARLVYPRLNILGFDMAGTLAGVGVWAEAAVFFPERVVGETVFPVPGVGLIRQPTIAMSNRAYTKFVVGADYTFPANIYLNGQFAHGFLHERGAAELSDYFLFNAEWRLARDKLKIVPFAGCLQISEWHQLKNKISFLWMPFGEYHPMVNASMVAGMRVITGEEGKGFGRIKDRDEIFFRLKYSF